MKKSSKHGGRTVADEEKDAAKAVGAIVAFYRRARGATQKELTQRVEGALSASSLAMIEGGFRLPSEKALRYLKEELALVEFQFEQLRNLTHHSNLSDEQRLRTIIPSDVIQGVPLFLRPAGGDAALLESASISDVWIVTQSPLTLSSPYYEMLRKRLTVGKLSFTYFMDCETGQLQYESLWTKLMSDPGIDAMARSQVGNHLRCILVPSTLTVFTFVLFNPGLPGRMFGRSLVMDQNGLTIGTISMDAPKVGAAYGLLSRIHNQLCRPGSKHPTPDGEQIPGIGLCKLVVCR